MLFFNANFICYYFYPTKKREEPKKESLLAGEALFSCREGDKSKGSLFMFTKFDLNDNEWSQKRNTL